MKYILAALMLLLPSLSYADDARLQAINSGTVASYAGAKTDLKMVVPVCSVDSNGIPQICAQPDMSKYVTTDVLSNYLKTTGGNLTGDLYLKSGISVYICDQSNGCANLYNSGNQTLTWTGVGGLVVGGDENIQGKITAGGGLSVVNGTATAPTPATTDNSTNIATTAYVNNAFQSVEYSVQGDISTTGSSIQIPFGASGLYAKFAYTGSGSASITFYSTTGTLSPVDIRRNSIWDGSGVETFTLDNGSVDASGVVADGTVYTASQDSSAYFIRVGGQVYFLTVWASNNGARAFMGVHKMI